MVKPAKVRVNGQITANEVRVITEDNTDLGVHSFAEACSLAQARGLDLVEIGPDDAPPTCRLIDYGHFRFDQQQARSDGTPPI